MPTNYSQQLKHYPLFFFALLFGILSFSWDEPAYSNFEGVIRYKNTVNSGATVAEETYYFSKNRLLRVHKRMYRDTVLLRKELLVLDGNPNQIHIDRGNGYRAVENYELHSMYSVDSSSQNKLSILDFRCGEVFEIREQKWQDEYHLSHRKQYWETGDLKFKFPDAWSNKRFEIFSRYNNNIILKSSVIKTPMKGSEFSYTLEAFEIQPGIVHDSIFSII